MNKRKCFVKGCENKVSLFAYWFGLRHCVRCDNLNKFIAFSEGERFEGYKDGKIVIKYIDGSILLWSKKELEKAWGFKI